IKYHLDVNPQMQKLRVRFAPHGSAGELRDQLALLVCARVFSTETRPTRLRGEFEQRLDREWHRIGDETEAACMIAQNTLTLAHDLDMALSSKLPASAQRAVPEISAHRKLLLRGRMFSDPPSSIVAQFPRYLQCDLTRFDRLRHGKAELDARRAEEFTPRWDRLMAVLSAEEEDTQAGEHLRVYRWMLEEYRVQVFAPELGTAMAVSPKKIDEQWDRIVRAAQG
ncbi:MAG: DUF3418 domain-containing protein, partial [Phycisphaerales bacterium]